MKLTLSHKAHSDMNLWIRSFHPYAVRHNDRIDLDSTNQIFNDLDVMYGGLIPQQDLGTETYAWVCSYGGSNFYISQTPDEDGQATITIEVAAESPPMKTKADSQPSPWASGSFSTKRSGLTCGPRSNSPAAAIGTTNRLIRTR